MKKIQYKLLFIITLFQVLMLLPGCAPKDATIKADLVTKAKSDKDFAGVRFTVDKGVVTLSGDCATEKSKSTVETVVKGVYGVNQVVNNITVAPVVIGTDQQLKQGVDSVLKDYPGLEAITKDSIVYLQGKIADNEVIKVKDAISMLKPKIIEARVTSQ